MFFIGVTVLQVVFDKYHQKVYVKMVSILNLEEKFNRVRRNFCFYLDVQDHGLARSLSRRIQDMGLQQEVFLTSRVTHVVSARRTGPAPARARPERPPRRADAMLQRCAAPRPPGAAPAAYVTLTVHKAIILLDRLYEIFFTAPRKAHVRFFTKHFIKIEFLDKVCRPVFKEFDEWPEISVVPDPLREKKEKQESPENQTANINQAQQNSVCPRMTRKSRPRIKEKEEKEPKGGYCEMCRAEYADAALHRRSPHHLAFVRDHTNFLALDSLISSGADVASFLDKAANGERRSLRNICNGDSPRTKRRRSGSREPPNGAHDTRNGHARRADRHYYKVVGVSTKLRSSGGFAPRRPSPPPCNGAKPLVVKFRKVRKSELSVLSDEAEQFMFPKRASSTSSTSGDEAEPAPPEPPPERRRLARPAYALKEESSEEDSWPEDKRRRKRRAAPAAKRGRRQALARAAKPVEVKEEPPPEAPPAAEGPAPAEAPPAEASPLREEPAERCMKWEDGRLKYTPAVEQLEFAFESVPRSEPWFETFRRQDRDEVAVRNVPKYFALYSKSPKLPYEIGQLPPLKPNCCPLSDLVKRDERPGPSRAYGTRGTKKQRVRKRAAAAAATTGRPRKSPREHASTLAILGSAGLLRRRADDAKSCASASASDDTCDAPPTEAHQASERLQRFLADAIEEAAEFDIADEDIMRDAPAPLDAAATAPDVTSLVSECERCDLIRDEIADRARGRRGRPRRPNRTGWPSRRRRRSGERKPSASASSAAPSTASDDDLSEPGPPRSGDDEPPGDDDEASGDRPAEADAEAETEADGDSSAASPLGLAGDSKRSSRSSPDSEDREIRKKRRALQGLLLQPVVRVARVDPGAARRLRSGGGGAGTGTGTGRGRARAARLR